MAMKSARKYINEYNDTYNTKFVLTEPYSLFPEGEEYGFTMRIKRMLHNIQILDSMRKFKLHFLLCVFFILPTNLIYAHVHWSLHGNDIMDVLGFVRQTETTKIPRGNYPLMTHTGTVVNKSWTKFISSDMIDNTEFHECLMRKYPYITLNTPKTHRLLFHWCYNEEPWSKYIEKHIRIKCHINYKNEEVVVKDIKFLVKNEQKRRNRLINKRTEDVFGFAHGGKDAKYALFFASMAYNIHLLGDQQTDNKCFLGVASTSTIIGHLIISLRMLDVPLSKPIEKRLIQFDKQYVDQHQKADAVMIYLKQAVPLFIKNAQKGSIYRRLESRGFKMVV